MSWQDRMEKWQQKTLLVSGIRLCKQVLWIEKHLHHKEFVAVANLAEDLLPKLEEELDAIRYPRSET